jgi:hypothetical protein
MVIKPAVGPQLRLAGRYPEQREEGAESQQESGYDG